MAKKLKITRFISVVETNQLSDDFYPNMTEEQAIEYERNAHPGEEGWGEYLFENDTLTYASAVEVIEEED